MSRRWWGRPDPVTAQRDAGALQAALDRATHAERELATTRAALDETRAAGDAEANTLLDRLNAATNAAMTPNPDAVEQVAWQLWEWGRVGAGSWDEITDRGRQLYRDRARQLAGVLLDGAAWDDLRARVQRAEDEVLTLTDRLHEARVDALADRADAARVEDFLGATWLSQPRPDGTCGQQQPGGTRRCGRPLHRGGQHLATSGAVVVAVWPHFIDRARDAALVARSERYGAELHPKRGVRLAAAATVVLTHQPHAVHPAACSCGWGTGAVVRTPADRALHIAEQLAAAGLLTTHQEVAP